MSKIILEGADCTGKSTLAAELQKITGYEIVKGSSFEIAQLGADGMFNHMMSLLNRNNIIIDRFYMSNFVYGHLYEKPTMTNFQFMELALETERTGALTVYTTADLEIIAERMDDRGDDDIKLMEIPKIKQAYEQTMNTVHTSQAMVLRIDSSVIDIRNSASTVAEIANLTERKIYLRDGL